MEASEVTAQGRGRDLAFAGAVVGILAILFLPIPPMAIDMGLAFSVALSVLILMVALWIQKPLEFSAFPTVLLIATLLRLALSIASTRLILSDGHKGVDAAGHVISGFSQFVMSGDFVIGIVVFIILITVNFLVITKGATRIAEVGARFTLDAIPGKQMAIDADLSAGLIDEKEAQKRRRELEEESAFFGSMDGASKFVRGEAVASLITIAVNIFGGIVIGVTRHGMPLSKAADVFVQLSVGDGLVSQIPALVVSLAAGLLVSKGGTRGQAQQAVLGQLGAYPRALMVAAALMFVFSIVPGLPMIPFLVLGGCMSFIAYSIPKQRAEQEAKAQAKLAQEQQKNLLESRDSVKETLKLAEIELCLGKHLASYLATSHGDLAHRVSKMRKKFAQDYGFVLPDVKLSDSLMIPPKSYQIKIHGTVVATQEIRPGDLLVVLGDGPVPDVPGDEVREPAFGMKALWVSDVYMSEIKRQGFQSVDGASVLLTHLSEVIRNNLPQLLSYKDVRNLLDGLDSEYKRLLDDICPSQISYSGLQSVLKLLLAERVSIRNLSLILEAIAEIAPHARRAEQLVEHVRVRIAQQICGDLAEGGALNVLRLGNKWDIAFHQSLKRDAKGDVVEFDIDPRLVEQFGAEASDAIKTRMGQVQTFAVVTAPDARPYVRMIIERMFSSLPVLSHLEIARGVEVNSLGTIS
ncbi:flagellar biosynthesis protein FlhA [Microvirga lotononidis]|uniref:Flagellar biosynthesis protein FlhA n=1 Tax=Microvirga lotononidis TaxID=864069 RepID=I4YLR6_9HYPH|nr:flagellar biosynthesis protein FlhA [Microvirga lotononidis]EIM24908.1 flagellar biosynthesis protein FlhA [Microvirga lotononidis]WQO29591.1 flagellar biosynthesis protein FlhA [Microvirga lotononidis]